MMQLQPYNPAATCPKCGGDDISTSYQKNDHLCWAHYNRHPLVGDIEHMDRYCRRCGYCWAEACLEDKPKPQVDWAKIEAAHDDVRRAERRRCTDIVRKWYAKYHGPPMDIIYEILVEIGA